MVLLHNILGCILIVESVFLLVSFDESSNSWIKELTFIYLCLKWCLNCVDISPVTSMDQKNTCCDITL